MREAKFSPDGRVFRSSNGTLYLVGGSNRTSNLYKESVFDEKISAQSWMHCFEKRHSLITAFGGEFVQLIVPEKLTVYPLRDTEFLSVFGDIGSTSFSPPGRKLMRLLSHPQVIYPDNFLISQTANFKIFPRTDSHWTWAGAFSAFQVLMSNTSFSPNYLDFVSLNKISLNYMGDLSGSFEDEDVETFERISHPPQVKRIYANALIGAKEASHSENDPGLHVGSHCIFMNDMAEFDKTVILFGSSFSEYRLEPSLLTSIFSFYFKIVHFVWSTSFDFDYLARHQPDLVVAEIPERFLTECPTDDITLESLAMTRLAAWKSAQ